MISAWIYPFYSPLALSFSFPVCAWSCALSRCLAAAWQALVHAGNWSSQAARARLKEPFSTQSQLNFLTCLLNSPSKVPSRDSVQRPSFVSRGKASHVVVYRTLSCLLTPVNLKRKWGHVFGVSVHTIARGNWVECLFIWAYSQLGKAISPDYLTICCCI